MPDDPALWPMILVIGAFVAGPAVVARIRDRSRPPARRRRESGADGGSGPPDEGHMGADDGDGDGGD